MYGPIGMGLTHLAIAVGLHAYDMSMPVKFYTVAALVMRLGEKRSEARWKLKYLFSEIQRAQLLIQDEWGYIPVE